MLLRHHEKTQELEYRQQRAVHALREDQVLRQHTTELCNQQDYMQRAERDLRKKHALELKQQPKSLKVRTRSRIIDESRRVIFDCHLLPILQFVLSSIRYPRRSSKSLRV